MDSITSKIVVNSCTRINRTPVPTLNSGDPSRSLSTPSAENTPPLLCRKKTHLTSRCNSGLEKICTLLINQPTDNMANLRCCWWHQPYRLLQSTIWSSRRNNQPHWSLWCSSQPQEMLDHCQKSRICELPFSPCRKHEDLGKMDGTFWKLRPCSRWRPTWQVRKGPPHKCCHRSYHPFPNSSRWKMSIGLPRLILLRIHPSPVRYFICNAHCSWRGGTQRGSLFCFRIIIGISLPTVRILASLHYTTAGPNLISTWFSLHYDTAILSWLRFLT